MKSTKLGVVIVCYNSADEVMACVDSLIAGDAARLAITIVDNNSPDGSGIRLREWLGQRGLGVTLIDSGRNGGYAFGVNAGLRHLLSDRDIDAFWILNPDMTVPAHSIEALTEYLATAPAFSLLGGRVIYADGTGRIQTDGGLVNRWTGITHNINLGGTLSVQPPLATTLQFIMGGNMVASRTFIERVGLMREDYFLYYEEVDWALRRPDDLPLAICPQLVVHHAAGTAIGSATLERGATRAAQFWKHRSRLMFLWRFNPAALPVAILWSLAKSAQLAVKRQSAGARGLLAGTLAGLVGRRLNL